MGSSPVASLVAPKEPRPKADASRSEAQYTQHNVASASFRRKPEPEGLAASLLAAFLGHDDSVRIGATNWSFAPISGHGVAEGNPASLLAVRTTNNGAH